MRVVLVAFLIAGCLNFDYSYESDSPSGTFPLEGRDATDSIWNSHVAAVISGPAVINEPQPAVLPEPGGGRDEMLELPSIDIHVDVRAATIKRGVLDWYLFPVEANPFVHADALHFAASDADPVQRTNGSHTVSFSFDRPGIWAVLAYGASERSDLFYISIDVAWDVEGSVYPQRAPDSQPPPGYDDMADRYIVALPTPLPGFQITTQQVQETSLWVGRDIDVGLLSTGGQGIACYGDDDANEDYVGMVDVTVSEVVFAIGAMPDSCNNGGWRYENNGPVHYTGTLRTQYAIIH